MKRMAEAQLQKEFAAHACNKTPSRYDSKD
jgi:hypothetical protein